MEYSLQLAILNAAANAIENEPVDMTTDLDDQSERARAAWNAVYDEQQKAKVLEQRFYAEFNSDEQDSGICNARDTAADYSLYAKHGDLVERSVEFWQCAIDSAQVCRDCA